MTHSYAWHDSFVCLPWLMYMCAMTYSYVMLHVGIRCILTAGDIHMCAMTYSSIPAHQKIEAEPAEPQKKLRPAHPWFSPKFEFSWLNSIFCQNLGSAGWSQILNPGSTQKNEKKSEFWDKFRMNSGVLRVERGGLACKHIRLPRALNSLAGVAVS